LEIGAIYERISREDNPQVLAELYARLEALQAQEGFYVTPQVDVSVSSGSTNQKVPWGPGDRINLAKDTLEGIARLGAEVGFPGGSVSGGVTGVHDKTTLRLPDEWQAYGAPDQVNYGNRRGFVPVNYDVSGTYGSHTASVNMQPRREGAHRDNIGGRAVWDFGYEYRPSESTSFSVNATPFGRRVVDPRTGATETDRSVMGRYTTRF
jgi:hypothetical protein